MPLALALGTALIGIASIGMLARRERQARRARTLGLFDGCPELFETSRIETGPDGFPRLSGTLAGRRVRLAAIPDTLTFRRLPQLWLAATVRAELPVVADLGVLARANGAEFFSITQRLPERLELPTLLTGQLLARGSHPDAQDLLDGLAVRFAELFADPRVKEVAVTRQGLRLCYQASQGKRGDHLLLRQSTFAESRIDPVLVLTIVDQLLGIEAALRPAHNGEPARPRTEALG